MGLLKEDLVGVVFEWGGVKGEGGGRLRKGRRDVWPWETLHLMVPLWSIFRSGRRPIDAASSVREGCLLRTGQYGGDHCGLCLFLQGLVDLGGWERQREFLWIWREGVVISLD